MKNIFGNITGCALFIISAIMSVRLFVTFGDTGLDQLILGIMAVGLQFAATYVFLFAYQKALEQSWGFAAACFFLYGLFFTISFVGTVGGLSSTDSVIVRQTRQQDDVYSALKAKADSLLVAIQSSEGRIQDYASRNYLTRGVRPEQAQSMQLRSEYDTAISQLVSYIPSAESGNVYNRLASFVGGSADGVKTGLWVIISICLEMGMLLCFCNGMTVNVPRRTIDKNVPRRTIESEIKHVPRRTIDVKKSPVSTGNGGVSADMLDEYVAIATNPDNMKSGMIPGDVKIAELMNTDKSIAKACKFKALQQGFIQKCGKANKYSPVQNQMELLH